MSATPYTQNLVLNFLLRGVGSAPAAWYVGLFTADPLEDPDAEVAIAGYARVSVSFVAALGGALRNSGAISFAAATDDWGTITHYGIFDASTNGNLLIAEPFTDPEAVDEDVAVEILAGELEIKLE